MRLTTKGRFAVTAMIDLALRSSNGPVALAAISQRQQISLSYLEQLFGKLRRHESESSPRRARNCRFGAVRRLRIAEFRAQDRDAPPDQPARDAIEQHEQEFMGKHPLTGAGNALMQHDARLLGIALDAAGDVVQDQRIEAQAAIQRLAQSFAAQHRVTQHRETSRFHAPGILAEKLIIEGGGDRAPQRPVVLRRNARLRHLQQARREADVRQQLVGVQIAAAQ